MKTCEACKEENLDESVFCISCGIDISKTQEMKAYTGLKTWIEKFCTKCGRRLEIDDYFCKSCGEAAPYVPKYSGRRRHLLQHSYTEQISSLEVLRTASIQELLYFSALFYLFLSLFIPMLLPSSTWVYFPSLPKILIGFILVIFSIAGALGIGGVTRSLVKLIENFSYRQQIPDTDRSKIDRYASMTNFSRISTLFLFLLIVFVTVFQKMPPVFASFARLTASSTIDLILTFLIVFALVVGNYATGMLFIRLGVFPSTKPLRLVGLLQAIPITCFVAPMITILFKGTIKKRAKSENDYYTFLLANSLASRLLLLKESHASGKLNDTDYTAKKKELLSRFNDRTVNI